MNCLSGRCFYSYSLDASAVSDLFRGVCYTAAAAVLFSTLASFTLVPFLSSRIGKLEKINKQTFIGRFINWFEDGIQNVSLKIRGLLVWSFNHKIVVFVSTFLLFIGSLMLVPLGFIGTEFASIGDRGEFYLDIEMPKNSTIEQTNLLTRKAEVIIEQNPYVTSVFTTVGAQEDGIAQPYLSEILVKILPHDEREVSTEECAREIKTTLQDQLVGAKIMIAQSVIIGGKDVDPIEMYVTGNNIDTILVVAEVIKKCISQIPEVIDAKLSLEVGMPEITIKPDREKMTRLGIPFELLGASLNNAFSGNQDAMFREGNNEYDINIQLDNFDRKDIQDIKNFSLVNIFGNTIYLHQFAEISETESPSKIERRNRIPSVRVISQIAGRSVGVIGEDIIREVNTLKMPSSVSVVYGGEMEIQDEGFETIGWAFIISIVLVYLIIVQ